MLSRNARWVGSLIVVSFALNLFLAGNLLGREFRRPNPALTIEDRLDAIWKELPEADQPLARKILDTHRDHIMDAWGALRPAAIGAGASVRKTPFIAEEAHEAFDSFNARNQDLRLAIQETVVEVAAGISPDGRKALKFPAGP